MNIKQIAKEAGVSVATVSRVLNHPENVAEATRHKIEKVMEEAGYRPNWFAQGLNFNRTKTIGIIVPHILNTLYMEIAKGVEDVALQKGYITFIGNGEMNPKCELDYMEHLETRRVDGIITMFSSIDEKRLREFEKRGMPIVLIGQNKEISDCNMVKINHKNGSEVMTKHLLSCGHRRIAFMQGFDPIEENQSMREGFTKVMENSGNSIDEDMMVMVNNSIDGGYLGVKKLLSDGHRPDAIFCTSDIIAFGAMDAMKEMGVKIPEDIALAGYGNYRMSNMVEPKLTTSEIPAHKMGVYGARLLFDLIEAGSEEKSEPKTITLQSRLKIRKSCGHTERIGEMF
ncbi:MAG: LacI family DNA-binding transcriptional regulator [Bacillota bacterium]|nr:LacI family DNA-binding transcriptional regulator [Bacillota bacterium]